MSTGTGTGACVRYVTVPQIGDLGELVVMFDHTAVYEGRDDAAPAYVQRLRSLDPNGRTCEDPPPPPPPPPPAPVAAEDDEDRRPAAPAPAPAPRPAESSGSGPYPNCKVARAAGDGPLYAGEPGYSRKLDGDGDGVACE